MPRENQTQLSTAGVARGSCIPTTFLLCCEVTMEAKQSCQAEGDGPELPWSTLTSPPQHWAHCWAPVTGKRERKGKDRWSQSTPKIPAHPPGNTASQLISFPFQTETNQGLWLPQGQDRTYKCTWAVPVVWLKLPGVTVIIPPKPITFVYPAEINYLSSFGMF